jgi:8-oxo-dGTP pyrophosphatase MutT (NUDIX family)
VKADVPRIFEVAELDLVFEPREWRFAIDRADEIAQHWRARRAEKPELFDGRILLLGRHALVAGDDDATILRGSYFEVDFSAFLAWRDFGFPDRQVCNCFSMAALRSADGAFMLGEMSAHTANAGSIYFASGTPDAQDVFAGKVDLTASVTRELREETGLGADDVAMAPNWTIVYAPPRIACMKSTRIAASAFEVKARIDAFLRRENQRELARIHVVAAPPDIDAARSPAFIVDYLRYALGADQS